MTEEFTYVGIDVAKDRVDVAARPEDQNWSVQYDEAGLETLVAKLRVLEPTAVILEATGGLEPPLVASLAAAALPVAVVNPRQLRDFAKSTGQLAKNDKLDGLGRVLSVSATRKGGSSDRQRGRGCRLADPLVAPIGCSWYQAGFLFPKPLTPKFGSTFLPLQRATTLFLSVDRG